jgi:hypothetical protein
MHDKAVKKAAASLAGSGHRYTTAVSRQLEEHLNLPTTTIGSFPQTPELRRVWHRGAAGP